MVAELSLHGRPLQLFAMHAGPAVALEYVASSLSEDDQRAVFADSRNRLDESLVSQVSEIAPMRVERAILAVASLDKLGTP